MTGASIVRKLTQNVSKAGTAGLLAVAGIAVVAGVAEAQQVGTAAAVNPAAQARSSSGSRTIVIGQSIAHRERIRTTSAGSVQLLFLDKTSMTIGPNSDLAIDEYVYDPGSNTGKLAATLTKGVMRFVGGQISHAGNAQVATPNAVVGIRGGVGIFSPNAVYIAYGEGNVRSGASSVTLTAGDYTQTLGGGTPPTNPTSPPSGFLQSVLAMLQSQGGQGGGARATASQVNQARTTASGSSTGNIASNVQNTANRTVNNTSQAGAASSINQTIQTTVTQTRAELDPPKPPNPPDPDDPGTRYLTGYTGGLVSSSDDYGPIIAALGRGRVRANAQGGSELAVFSAAQKGKIWPEANNYNYSNDYSGSSSDEFQIGRYQFGPGRVNNTTDPLLPDIANILLPGKGPNGEPRAQVNRQAVSRFEGGLVDVSAPSQGGAGFCDCEYTRWGLWVAGTERPSSSNGGQITDTAVMYWVAGRAPTNMPSHGTATYTGHAIANIYSGSSGGSFVGAFENEVNFGTRRGNVSINNLDGTNYAGQVNFVGSTPTFKGTLGGSDVTRSMELSGSFFHGRTSPVGEMGGHLRILGGSNYGGAGIFVGKMQ